MMPVCGRSAALAKGPLLAGTDPPAYGLDITERRANVRIVTPRSTIAVGQLRVGDEGYCPVDAVYLAPSSPSGTDEGRDVAATARYLLPDAGIYLEPSPRAKLRLRRLEDGLAIRLPPGDVPSRYRRRPVPGSLPVVAIE
jgi:hypothetical protein